MPRSVKLTSQLTVYLTRDEKSQIEVRARRDQLSAAKFSRWAILEAAERRERDDPAGGRELFGENADGN